MTFISSKLNFEINYNSIETKCRRIRLQWKYKRISSSPNVFKMLFTTFDILFNYEKNNYNQSDVRLKRYEASL